MSYDSELMYNVAKLYYLNRITQENIARKLNISKYKVNRILKSALAQGIIQIRIIKIEKNDKRL